MTDIPDEAIRRLSETLRTPEIPGGRYVIRNRIGRGGMGEVWLAEDRRLGREVAVKIARDALDSESLARRLETEARTIAGLDHPGIVPVHDAGRLEDGRAWYAMRLVQGETLEHRLATIRGRPEALRLVSRLAEIVAFAHRAGVLHRDLKPSNVMVGAFGEVLLMDWGLARRVDGGVEESGGVSQEAAGRKAAGTATRDGEVLGTPGFMAPEVETGGARCAGKEADVFALGRILLEALPAKPDARLRAVAGKAAAREPADRYGDAALFAADLSRAIDGFAVLARREGAFERAGRWLARNAFVGWLLCGYLLLRILVYVAIRR